VHCSHHGPESLVFTNALSRRPQKLSKQDRWKASVVTPFGRGFSSSSALLRRQRIEFGNFLVSEFRQTTELAKASLADAANEICALAVADVPDIALQKRSMY
jgi:hypothetical protein